MKTVLIIDDSAPVRERMAEMLSENPGIEVVGEEESAEHVLENIERLRPDAVVLDIRLPGKNGIEALKEIKSFFPETTVVILTNYDYSQYRKKSLAAGADYFFNKAREFHKVAEALIA